MNTPKPRHLVVASVLGFVIGAGSAVFQEKPVESVTNIVPMESATNADSSQAAKKPREFALNSLRTL